MDENNITASTVSGTDETNNDITVIPNDNRTDTCPNPFFQSSTQETDIEFVTVEEIAESLRKKEHDSLSLNGSHLSGSNGSISQLSGSLKTGKFDSSLNALKEKKDQLINSLKNALGDSSNINLDVSSTEDQMNASTTSLVSDSGNPECRPNIGTSTPFPESKPLAARFLKNWKPSFIEEDTCESDEIDTSDDENGYEKAMASLKEVLSDTSVDTASKLDSYSSMLDAFKQEDDKKYDEMISTITSENGNLEECLENATKEVDEFIEKLAEKNIGLELSPRINDSVIEVDSKDCTLVARGELVTLSDTETIIENVPKTPIVITIESSQSEEDDTIIPSEKFTTSEIPVESTKPNVTNNQKTTDNAPKENDLEILIIEGDEDIDINVDDEDLLLASDDESKQDKSENKKVSPQVPLVKDLEVFISNDPDENRDNNDPKWDYLRNLGTDYDRYLAVRSRWKNIQIPNPKKDLTCRCRNPVQQLNGYPAFIHNNNNTNQNRNNSNNNNNNRASRKRLHSPENQYGFSKRAKRESCTILFDRNIDQLAEDVRNERQNIFNEQEQALQQLADLQHMEKYVTKQKGGTMMDMKRLENKHMIDTRKCVEDFRRRIEKLQEMARAKLTVLRRASEEVRQFHEFYPNEDEKNGDTKSLVYLTDTEVQEILEVEEMLLSFPSFYNE